MCFLPIWVEDCTRDTEGELSRGLNSVTLSRVCAAPLAAKDSETEGPEVGLQEFRQIGTEFYRLSEPHAYPAN